MKHDRRTLTTDSVYVGRLCPITRRTLHPGDQVVVCAEKDWAFLVDAFLEHVQHSQGRCLCGNPAGIAPIPPLSPAKPPPAKPPPAQQPSPISPPSVAARMAVVAAAVSLVTIICVLGALLRAGVIQLGSSSASGLPPGANSGTGDHGSQPTLMPATAQPNEGTFASHSAATPIPTDARVFASPSASTPIPPEAAVQVAQPNIAPRAAWNAAAPGDMVPQTPARIVLTHEEGQECCSETVESRIRSNQNVHKGKGWPDIAYHFIIAPDGRIFEGRDVVFRADSSYAAKNPDYPLDGTIVIGILGNYNMQQPTSASILSIEMLMAWLCQQYHIDADQIYNLRDIAPIHVDARLGRTTSPGTNMPDSSTFRAQVRKLLNGTQSQ